MWNLSMYPTNGNCPFPDIMDQLANGRVETVTVESGDFTIEEWEIGINLSEIDGEMYLIPFITYEDEFTPKCRLECYLGIDKTKYRIRMKTDLSSKCHFRAVCMKVSDLKPNILNNGALIIKYGIRVEAFQNLNTTWRFQLENDLFDSRGKQIMVRLWKNEYIRCHQQIAAIHHDNSIETSYQSSAFTALQIAHGDRYSFSLSSYSFLAYADYAHLMGFRNVIHYCQWQLIQNPSTYPVGYYDYEKFRCVLRCNMRSYLIHLIREMNSKNKLMDILEKMNIDKMSGESMKTFMKFLLYD